MYMQQGWPPPPGPYAPGYPPAPYPGQPPMAYPPQQPYPPPGYPPPGYPPPGYPPPGYGDPGLGEPGPPLFRLTCPAGATVQGVARTEAQLRTILWDDLKEAVRLARNAATLLNTHPRSANTIRIYTRIFGHAPDRRIPWAPTIRDSGTLTARRLTMAGDALNRRVIQFDCGAHPTANAETLDTRRIRLYARYWTLTRPLRAAILVHECMHMVFLNFLLHNRDAAGNTIERRRINAHCYEALVLLLAGQTPEPHDLTQCRHSPA